LATSQPLDLDVLSTEELPGSSQPVKTIGAPRSNERDTFLGLLPNDNHSFSNGFVNRYSFNVPITVLKKILFEVMVR
jgi:hypothetical protein